MDLLYTVSVFRYVWLPVYLPLAADCLLIGLTLNPSNKIVDPTLFLASDPASDSKASDTDAAADPASRFELCS